MHGLQLGMCKAGCVKHRRLHVSVRTCVCVWQGRGKGATEIKLSCWNHPPLKVVLVPLGHQSPRGPLV